MTQGRNEGRGPEGRTSFLAGHLSLLGDPRCAVEPLRRPWLPTPREGQQVGGHEEVRNQKSHWQGQGEVGAGNRDSGVLGAHPDPLITWGLPMSPASVSTVVRGRQSSVARPKLGRLTSAPRPGCCSLLGPVASKVLLSLVIMDRWGRAEARLQSHGIGGSGARNP